MIKLKPIVKGTAKGRVVKVDSLSFFGEVDPEKGVIIVNGKRIKDKILVIGKSRGSTVGSYVIYGLHYYNNRPKAIVMVRSEPIVITGAIIAGIPLFVGLPREVFDELRDNDCVMIEETGEMVILEEC